MNDTEAVEMADLVAELWGQEWSEARRAFYATAINVLDREAALRAVVRCFRSERFAPTPQQVLDAAAGTLEDDIDAQLDAGRRALRDNTPLEPRVREALIDVFGNLDAVPDGRIARTDRDSFAAAMRHRSATDSLPELTGG